MKFTRSLLFRLALTYAGLFLTSVILLLAIFYWVTISLPSERVKDDITTEMRRMLAIYDDGDLSALSLALQRRGIAPIPPQTYHALIDPQGKVVTANLPSWPGRSQNRWLNIEADIYRDGEEEDHEALVFDARLADGSRLLLGRDVEDIEEIKEALWQAGAWGLPSLALLAVIGAMLMSTAVTRRLNIIDAAARRVMKGSLHDRIPRVHTGDDLDRLASTLNEMLARIEKSMLSVRRVSDSVAHELRTPLARMQVRLVDYQKSAAAISPEMLDELVAEVELMISMFDAVLRISRIESGRHTIELQPVELASVVSDVVEYYEPAIEQASLHLSVDVASGLAIVGDKDLIFQALANLIDNAVKFTPVGGEIVLSGKRKCDAIIVTLTDTGPGISQEDREFITERFYRGTDRTENDGFGLGLALVEAVAELHHSHLDFDDAKSGFVVRWTFPNNESTLSVSRLA